MKQRHDAYEVFALAMSGELPELPPGKSLCLECLEPIIEETPILADEVLSPDSSRFWPAESWRPGGPQPSFDKQFVRQYLMQVDWDRTPPAPGLPDSVVRQTRDKYVEAYRRLTGQEFQ